MKDFALAATDTVLFFLSPFSEAILPKDVLAGIMILLVVAFGIFISVILRKEIPDTHLGIAAICATWLALLFVIQTIKANEPGMGLMGFTFMMLTTFIRLIEGAGLIHAGKFILSPFAMFSAIVTCLYAFIALNVVDFYSLSFGFQVLGVLHISMVFLTLTGIWGFVLEVSDNGLNITVCYLVFSGALIFTQFFNVAEYKDDGFIHASGYYLYLAVFPVGIILGLVNRLTHKKHLTKTGS